MKRFYKAIIIGGLLIVGGELPIPYSAPFILLGGFLLFTWLAPDKKKEEEEE